MQSQSLKHYQEYLTRMGQKTFAREGRLWATVRPRVFQPSPVFDLRAINRDEVAKVLKGSNALACRWFSIAASGPADASLFLLRPPFDLNRIQSKARNQTRRGLEKVKVSRGRFEIGEVDEAFQVYAENVSRLGLFSDHQALAARWERWKRVVTNPPEGVSVWKARHDEQLIAFAVVVETPFGTEIVCQRSHVEGRSHYPNNALVFEIATHAFQQGQPLLSYGLGEFGSTASGLDHFKTGMGFEELRLTEHYAWAFPLNLGLGLLKPRQVQSLYRSIQKLRSRRP